MVCCLVFYYSYEYEAHIVLTAISDNMKDKAAKVSASKAVMQGFDKLYEKVPAFEDVFTETSFYVFAITLVILSSSSETSFLMFPTSCSKPSFS